MLFKIVKKQKKKKNIKSIRNIEGTSVCSAGALQQQGGWSQQNV